MIRLACVWVGRVCLSFGRFCFGRTGVLEHEGRMLLRVGAESVGLFRRSSCSSALCGDPWCCLCSFFIVDLSSSPWMELGVSGLLLNFIAFVFGGI